jgi:heme-degrading monooxygenase HmoA
MHHGPAPRTAGAVVVSLTEFTARRFRDLPGIARAGIALQSGWWAMPGDIGVLLYAYPAQRKGGSLSVWESEADLRRFIRLPRHVAVMRAYRDRVTVRSATWTSESVDLHEAWARREEHLRSAALPRTA